MQQHIAKFIYDCDGVLQVGTGCSGTDLILTVLNSLSDYWKQVWDLKLQVEHTFSVEKEEFKQKFILQHHSPSALFSDITTLTDGPQVNLISGEEIDVPTVTLWVSGFECDNFSGLSSDFRSGSTVGCVSDNTGKSGRTATGCLKYIVKARPPLVILENVKNLGGGSALGEKLSTDLHQVIAVMNRAGYVVHYEVLAPTTYGCPQSRDRLYIFAVLVSQEPVEQLDHGFAMPHFMRQLPLFLRAFRIPTRELSEFLLDHDNYWVERWIQAQREVRRSSGNSGGEKDKKFEVDHLAAYRQMGLTWPPDCKEDPGFPERVDYLVRRQLEIAWFHNRLFADDPTDVETTKDLNMSMGWQNEKSSSIAQCLVSTSRPF